MAFTWALMAIPEVAADPGRDEPATSYHLFRPVPPEAMRPLSTDRPDRTEAATTVDAGHFQLEMDLVAWAHDRSLGVLYDRVSLGTMNIKIGLTRNTDLQLVIESWSQERTEPFGLRPQTRSGFGDVAARFKLNLLGNDGGRTSVALMPFVALPASQNDLGREDPEIGLIVPFGLELPRGWESGTMIEVDVTPAVAGSTIWIASATASHDIVGTLAGYFELFGTWPVDHAAPRTVTFDVGLTYGIGRDIQLDGGLNLGFTDDTEDATVFLGFTVRQ